VDLGHAWGRHEVVGLAAVVEQLLLEPRVLLDLARPVLVEGVAAEHAVVLAAHAEQLVALQLVFASDSHDAADVDPEPVERERPHRGRGRGGQLVVSRDHEVSLLDVLRGNSTLPGAFAEFVNFSD
jgi:hypothetical protein